MDKTKRQITKIAREANKLVIRTMKDDGIGSGEMDLIHLVRHNPGISQKEACLRLNMDKGAVARRTASLEQKGYLTRKENPADGRSQLRDIRQFQRDRQIDVLLFRAVCCLCPSIEAPVSCIDDQYRQVLPAGNGNGNGLGENGCRHEPETKKKARRKCSAGCKDFAKCHVHRTPGLS